MYGNGRESLIVRCRTDIRFCGEVVTDCYMTWLIVCRSLTMTTGTLSTLDFGARLIRSSEGELYETAVHILRCLDCFGTAPSVNLRWMRIAACCSHHRANLPSGSNAHAGDRCAYPDGRTG